MTNHADVTWSTEVTDVLCLCCGDEIPVEAKVLICPPCMQTLVIHTSYPPTIKCAKHGKAISTGVVPVQESN